MRALGLALSVLFAATMAIAADEIRLPDPATGVIDGKEHVLFWPSVHPPPEPGEKLRLLPATGCTVHLVPSSDPDQELTRACGEWFLVPDGRYRFWLETANSISPWPGVFVYSSEPLTGRGMGTVAGVVPGGRVAIAPDGTIPAGAGVRLLHLQSRDERRPAKAFDRRVTREKAKSGALLPAGQAIAGIFDRSGNALAISHPVSVVAGKTSNAVAKPPASGSDVVLVLDRPRVRTSWAEDEVELTIGTRKPDVFVSAADRVFAVWYGITESAPLQVASKSLRLEPRELKLRPGKVITVRDKLVPLPNAKISILGPASALDKSSLALEVRREGQKKAIERVELEANSTYTFAALPAERLDAVVQVGAWDVVQPLDLSSGDDASLTFDLDPLTVRGTVYLGDDPAPHAEIAFEADRGSERVTADADGRYEINLWDARGDYAAGVTIPGRLASPYVEAFLVVDRDLTFDFHVPRTSYQVVVNDAKSGRPIERASIVALNVWGNDNRVSQSTTTDTEGRAHLQPLRKGELSLVVKADGYLDARPATRSITSSESAETIGVALEPAGEVIRLTLRAAGRPLSQAETLVVATTDRAQAPVWQGTADGDGMIEIPRRFAGNVALVRHPDAASIVRRLDDADATWNLGVPSPELTVQLDPAPRDRRGARVAAWLDSFRVSGPALSFLTWGYEATDARGIWSARNLPPGAIRVLLWNGSSDIATGLFDHGATAIEYPWPSTVRVRPVD